MSAPARRRKKRIMTFVLLIEAQEMIVSYQPNWTEGYGHFEFRSPHDPARRIPVSETGYRSYFAPMEEVEACASPQDYAREIVLSTMKARLSKARDDIDQLALF